MATSNFKGTLFQGYASRSTINISGNSTFTSNNIKDNFKGGTLTVIQSTLLAYPGGSVIHVNFYHIKTLDVE